MVEVASVRRTEIRNRAQKVRLRTKLVMQQKTKEESSVGAAAPKVKPYSLSTFSSQQHMLCS